MNDKIIKEPFTVIPEKEAEEIRLLMKPYFYSNITLSEIFNTDPKIYSNVLIQDMGFSTRLVNAMTKWTHYIGSKYYTIKTLCDLLNCSVKQVMNIRNLGVCALIECIYITKQYINSFKEIFPKGLTYNSGINECRLAYGLKNILDNEPFKITFRDKEMPYIMRYMETIEWIDKDIYMAAYNKDKYLLDLLSELSEFFAPIHRQYTYKQKIGAAMAKLPLKLRTKSALPFIQAYFLNKETIVENPLYDVDNQMIIADILNISYSKKILDYNTFHYIMDFILWLNFDFNNIMNKEINELSDLDFNRTIKGDSKQKLMKFKYEYQNSSYDIVAIAWAFKGKSRLVYETDLIRFIGAEKAKLLWYALSVLKYHTRLYHYSVATDVMIFNQ